MQVDVIVPTIPDATQAQLEAREVNLGHVRVLTKSLQSTCSMLAAPMQLITHFKVCGVCGVCIGMFHDDVFA